MFRVCLQKASQRWLKQTLKNTFKRYNNTSKRHKSSGIQYQNPQWQQTMLRIRNPSLTIPFYQTNFGMQLIHEYHFQNMGFSLYFMGTPIPNITYPKSGTKESEKLLWNYPGVTLEFTHNHDSNDQTIINNGNVEPYRGFGHIAFNHDDVYKSYDDLVGKGVKFQKAPNEGRMKGLSFALDPDGYWVEICDRKPNKDFTNNIEYNLSQTMLRVKDPVKSLDFYCNKLGMKKVCESHIENGQFSVYFLSSQIDKRIDLKNKTEEEKWGIMKESFHPYLELTHNWVCIMFIIYDILFECDVEYIQGTEKDDDFKYHNGNVEPRGFGHTGFLVNDLDKTCELLQGEDVLFHKLPDEGKIKGIAFAIDPDGYWIEFIQRGVAFL